MKLWAIVGAVVITLVIAVVAAMQTGEKSPIFAQGVLEIPEDLAGKAAGIETLYMVVYDLDSPRPMPYGAVRFRLAEAVAPGGFFDFVITKERLQIMGGMNQPPPKRMRIKARLDRDGQGGMDQPGDITGQLEEVAFGAKDLRLKLDSLVEGG